MDTDELIQRIKSGVILLNLGHTLKVGDLTFSCKDENIFSVAGWTTNNNLDSLTKQKALTEFYEIKFLFARMVNTSFELSEFIKVKQINYYLGFDCGKGGIDICNEIDGIIKWEIELKE